MAPRPGPTGMAPSWETEVQFPREEPCPPQLPARGQGFGLVFSSQSRLPGRHLVPYDISTAAAALWPVPDFTL